MDVDLRILNCVQGSLLCMGDQLWGSLDKSSQIFSEHTRIVECGPVRQIQSDSRGIGKVALAVLRHRRAIDAFVRAKLAALCPCQTSIFRLRGSCFGLFLTGQPYSTAKVSDMDIELGITDGSRNVMPGHFYV